MTDGRSDGYSVAGATAGVVSVAPSECGVVPRSAGTGDGTTGAVALCGGGAAGADPSGVIKAVVGSVDAGAVGIATGAGSVDAGVAAADGVSAGADATVDTAGTVALGSVDGETVAASGVSVWTGPVAGAATLGSVVAAGADPSGTAAASTGSEVPEGSAGRDAGPAAPSECGSLPDGAVGASLAAGSVSLAAGAGATVAFSAGGVGVSVAVAGSDGALCNGMVASVPGSSAFSGGGAAGSVGLVDAASDAGVEGGPVRGTSGDGTTVAGAVVTAASAGDEGDWALTGSWEAELQPARPHSPAAASRTAKRVANVMPFPTEVKIGAPLGALPREFEPLMPF